MALLATKMVVYAISFLAFILLAAPYGFHKLGQFVFPASLHDMLVPGPTQRSIGIGLFLFGFLGYLFCSLWLVIVGKGPFVEFDPPRQFVATGPFRWTRNPVAAMLLVTVLGEGVFFGSAGILTFFLVGIPVAQWQVIRIEEPRLRARFGDAYLEYCRRVPRWLPRRPIDDRPV